MKVLHLTRTVLVVSASIVLVFVLYFHVMLQRSQFMHEYLKQLSMRLQDDVILETEMDNLEIQDFSSINKHIFRRIRKTFLRPSLVVSNSSKLIHVSPSSIESSNIFRRMNSTQNQPTVSNSSIESSKFTERMNSTQNQPTVSNSSIESSKFTGRMNSTQNQPTVSNSSIESSKFTGRMNSTQNQPTIVSNLFKHKHVSLLSIESSNFTRRTNSTQNQPKVVPNSSLPSIESSKFTGGMNLTENRPKTVSSIGKTKKLWCEDLSAKYPLVLNFTHLVTKEKINLTKPEPINYHPYQYIFNASHVCKANESVKVVIVVKSRVDNFSLRNIIRETWVKEAVADGSKVVFSLGNSKKKPVREKVNEEYKKFKDVVQEDFYDHYYNNSLKTIMGIRWIARFCPNAIYVLMVDDDVIVNYRNLANFFKSVSSDSLETLYSGNIKPTPGPIRNRRVRWYMPENQFPFDCYPPYLSGGALLTSGEVIRKMNIALPYVKKFKYDDVYLAIIVQKLGIRPQGNPRVTMRKAGAKHLKNIIVSHGFSKPSDYSEAYQIIME